MRIIGILGIIGIIGIIVTPRRSTACAALCTARTRAAQPPRLLTSYLSTWMPSPFSTGNMVHMANRFSIRFTSSVSPRS